MIQEHSIPFSKLSVTPEEIYEAMGYCTAIPDKDIREMVKGILEQASALAVPRFIYRITEGSLTKETLRIDDTSLAIGKIIGRQLSGSEAFALFIATTGSAFGEWLEEISRNGDIVVQYIVDLLGSCLAEKAADYMEVVLQEEIAKRNWKHTNRFSPGYCEWEVSEQQKLFPLFPVSSPCSVQLTASSLMIPIKSVSGIIGLGSKVRKTAYSCGLCNLEYCYKRKRNK